MPAASSRRTVVRWPPYESGGLRFHLEEVNPPKFYFNGATARFRLIIENPGQTASPVRAQLVFAMRTAEAHFGEGPEHVEPQTVPAHGTVVHECLPQWLMVGEGTYQLNIPDQPTVPLADFTVHDKDIKDEQDTWAGEQLTIQKRTFWAFAVSIAASVLVAAVGIFIAFHH